MSVRRLAETVTVARADCGTRATTRGSSNAPVLVQPHVGAANVAGLTRIRISTVLVTPLALVPVSLSVNSPVSAEAEAATLSVAEAPLVGLAGTVTLPGETINVTPAGAGPIQAAASCTLSLTPFVDRSAIVEEFADDLSRAVRGRRRNQ